MPKDEWGVKRVCQKCAVRFYDLQNDPMTCPSCDATFDLASLINTRNRSVSAEKPKIVKPEPDEELDDTADVLDDDDVNADLDDDLLEDDEDDTVDLEEIADVAIEVDES